MKPTPSFIACLFLVISPLLLMVGCGVKQEPIVQQKTVVCQDQELHQKIDTLSVQLEQQELLIGQLQMSLLEKHAEVARLTEMNQDMVRQFVRNKANLRNRGDKVETVRLIAEVTTAINTAKENDLAGRQREAVVQAEEYLEQSKMELAKENFDGASYLADQALLLVQSNQVELGEELEEGEGDYVAFLAPLPMQLLKTSNVRTQPSLQAKVQYVLAMGKRVRAVGYQGQWVRVDTGDKGTGWIHYSLLRGI